MTFDLNEIEEKKLIALFNQHEKNLDYLLYLQSIVWNKPSKTPENSNSQDQYKLRDSLFENLEKGNPFPNDYVKKNIKWDSQLLRLEDYLANPYLKALNNLSFEHDDWRLSNKKLGAYAIFPYEEEYHYASNYNLKMCLAYFNKDYFYPSISLYGNEWMSLNPYEIRTMETPILTARGKALTLGLGLGYYAYMIHLKEEVKEVHIVEMDKGLIHIFNQYFLPLFPYKEKIHIHKADAFSYIETIKDRDYDFIFSDLWHDAGDGLPMYLKLKQHFNNFEYTHCSYWIEGAIVTYLRLLVIGVLKDFYYKQTNDYNDIQLLIKKKLSSYTIRNSGDIDSLLSIKGLNELLFN